MMNKAIMLIINQKLYKSGLITQEVYNKIIMQINKC